MRFAHPWALAALAAVLAALWLAFRARNSPASLRFPAPPKTEDTFRLQAGRWGAMVLQGLALTLAVLALARPQALKSRSGAEGQGIDIMLAMDTSLSMSATDLAPNRLGAAQETAGRFVRGRAEDRIGLVNFGGAPQLLCPLTLDYGALISQIDSLTPGMTNTDGTAIGDGLVSALNHLKNSQAKSRIIILLTDGRSNTGIVDPITAAKTAASLGVKIYTIGSAKRGSALMPVDDPMRGRVMVQIDDDLDEDLLNQIAETTGGRYFRATSVAELRDIYATIDKLEKSKLHLPDIVSKDDRYRGLVLAAALILLAEALLSNTWLLRWP
jgi:Ca-activated chloride channel family protein